MIPPHHHASDPPLQHSQVGLSRAAAACVVLFLALHAVTSAPLLDSEKAPQPRPPLHLRLDPNTATADELQLLPRIGPTLAARIIEARSSAETVAFRTLDDLDAVRGIGPVTLARIGPYLVFPATEAPQSAAQP
jgi:DNA uptake protein ComE-like DNA-binding protein